MTKGTKLSDVIADLEKQAEVGENLAQHGSMVSSLHEDVTAGVVAEKLREVISKLKAVTTL